MLKAMLMLREDLREKARWCYQSDGPAAVAKTLATDGTSAMVLYRLMQGAREVHLAPLEMVFNKLNSIVNSCVIGRGADFGPGFVIVHSHGVVINGKVRGGANVHLEHEVTLGDSGAGDCPVLGSNVYVGAGAKVIGPVEDRQRRARRRQRGRRARRRRRHHRGGHPRAPRAPPLRRGRALRRPLEPSLTSPQAVTRTADDVTRRASQASQASQATMQAMQASDPSPRNPLPACVMHGYHARPE